MTKLLIFYVNQLATQQPIVRKKHKVKLKSGHLIDFNEIKALVTTSKVLIDDDLPSIATEDLKKPLQLPDLPKNVSVEDNGLARIPNSH